MGKITEEYREDYIKKMRLTVGHAPLWIAACGVIIENECGEILLQRRKDNGKWGMPGGAMEIGEKFTDTARREIKEETGLDLEEMELFGIYSGEDRIIEYPNQDICIAVGILFKALHYSGTILPQSEEVLEHRFFGKDALPDNINPYDGKLIGDWAAGRQGIVVD